MRSNALALLEFCLSTNSCHQLCGLYFVIALFVVLAAMTGDSNFWEVLRALIIADGLEARLCASPDKQRVKFVFSELCFVFVQVWVEKIAIVAVA